MDSDLLGLPWGVEFLGSRVLESQVLGFPGFWSSVWFRIKGFYGLWYVLQVRVVGFSLPF
jgi:hypothetical protein